MNMNSNQICSLIVKYFLLVEDDNHAVQDQLKLHHPSVG